MNEPNLAAPFDSLFTPMPRPEPPPDPPDPGPLQVRTIDRDQHDDFAAAHSASFLQTPDWAAVKPDWRSESLGWFDRDELVGTALVLYRPVPGSGRSLAYVPEGPALDWPTVSTEPGRWLDPFVTHLRSRLAFAVRVGPRQVMRIWTAPTAKRGLADPQVQRFDELPADEVDPDGTALTAALSERGWVPLDRQPGFGSGQPRFGVQLRLADRTAAELLAQTNQQWRRNVARAVKAGVVVREGSIDDLGHFHRLYLETAERDGFGPRPASYFAGMWQALGTGPEPRLRLYVAELGPEPVPLACALTVQVGTSCWYAYGASSSQHRQAQASTALQWAAIRAAQARGCETYDLRGITDTLDTSDALSGLVRFKLGTGGRCVETVGEWELTLSPLWHRAFQVYRRIRS
jgi:lipid II:glycine glycyltransferase (peptidoglycan interpeptide bridge formation enzyme)